MILRTETFDKFGYDVENIKHFGKQIIILKCNNCNLVFENNYLGLSCNFCNKKPRSMVEKELFDFIKSIYNGEIQRNVRKILDNEFELDFYFPDKKLAIEFNGNYYHSEIEGGKTKSYHINKLNICNDKHIQLIQITEDEWINKQEIVKNRLKHVLELNTTNKIYARKCEIKEVN